MISSTSAITRRSLLLSAAVAAAIPGAKARAGQTPETLQVSVDPALLEPALEPANWEVEKDYSTETVDPPPPTEYCDLKLFPEVPVSSVALSGVLQAEDLDIAPNMVLVQEFHYASAEEAAGDYDHVLGEVQSLAAHKYYLSGPEFLTPVRATETEALVTHTAPNGANYALMSKLEGDRVLVLRAGAKGSDPAEALELMMSAIIESPEATPATGENANEITDWEVSGWRWNYGPIDIHPDRYLSPVCTE